jgi:uncharacterized RDD family membrane protein YckC
MQEGEPTADAVPVPTNLTGPRIIAAIIDIVAVFVFFVVLGMLLGDSESSDGSVSLSLNGLPALIFFVLTLAYYIVPEAMTGKTLGKMVMGLKVVKVDGSAYTWGNAIARNVLRIIDALPVFYLLGFIIVALSKRNQRLGDMAAGTIVVRDR